MKGVDNQKAILHAKRWKYYMNEKKRLLKVVIMWKFQILVGGRLFGK